MPQLAEVHRDAQLALRARLLRDLQRVWPALDWTAIDKTFPAWATAATTVIDRDRAASANVAARFCRAHRLAQGITGPAPIVLAPPIPREKVATVLTATCKARLKAAAARGLTGQQAMANAFVSSTGAASRLVLEGGRETVRRTAIEDPAARGWQRITTGRSCSFCNMLAGRGAVYREASSDFQAHDHCGCTAAPVY